MTLLSDDRTDSPERLEAPSADGAARIAPCPTEDVGAFWSVPTHLWLGLTLLLGLVLRLVNLNAFGFNSDEAVYAGQAASLAGNPLFVGEFPIFRAHPLLLPTLLSPLFSSGTPDLRGRVVVALFGVATLFVVYLLGRDLYGPKTGVLAALILAVMPYHLVVTRQLLLDGPAVFWMALAFWLLVRFVRCNQFEWLAASAATFGLAVLTKETAIVVTGALFLFLLVSPAIRRPARCGGAGPRHPDRGEPHLSPGDHRRRSHRHRSELSDLAAHPGLQPCRDLLPDHHPRRHRMARGGRGRPHPCLPLQPDLERVDPGPLDRRPARDLRDLSPQGLSVPPAGRASVGPAGGAGPGHVPGPPALERLGPIGRPTRGRRRRARLAHPLGVDRHLPVCTGLGPGRQGGVPGGRQAGHWIGKNLIPGTELMTIGPSMANILEYYGHRPALGLSVSSNPLHRNPAYTPIINPDRSVRTGQFGYLVWDAYSAFRSPSTALRLETLVARYHGVPVHTESRQRHPVIVIYEVHP